MNCPHCGKKPKTFTCPMCKTDYWICADCKIVFNLTVEGFMEDMEVHRHDSR